MRADEVLNKMIISFFVIVTGVVFSMYIFCLVFYPETRFSLTDIGRILVMGVVGDLPFLIFLSGRELNRKQTVVRIIIHALVLSVSLLFLAIWWDWISPNSITQIAFFLLTVMLVYAAVLFISSYRDRKLTEKLNKRLKERYHS